MHIMRAEVKFTEELLATQPADPKLHEAFIASNAPDAPTREEEIEVMGVEKVVELGKTIFPRDENGVPFIWDYQWKGYFKSVCSAFYKAKGKTYLPAFRKIIDIGIFVMPRRIKLIIPTGLEIGNCQRPLRAQTAQGERVALAHSETAPAGTTCEFEIHMLDEKMEKFVREWMDYGVYHGHGQWRNSGKGRFEWR